MKKRSRGDIAGVLCILCFWRTLVLISWCVLVCLFLRWKVVLPGDWIPEKLIDWNGWRENIRQFPICNIVLEHSTV